VCHVLIIEDESLVAMDLENILADEGATSFAFSASEDEAVASAIAQRPALITSDVRLIAGTGPRAVQRIHDQLGEIPVIFITASPKECEPCEPPGVILTKPLNRSAIKAAFHELGPEPRY
jgi:CheY-like chemotaxis protein